MKKTLLLLLTTAILSTCCVSVVAKNTATELPERNPSGEIVLQESYDAIPTSSKVIVNGKEIAFDSYNIGGNNFFKLRDIAMALSGTTPQFDIVWLSEVQVICLELRKSYSPIGGELTEGDGTVKKAIRTNTCVSIGECIYNFDLYNINGNNYFKLREIANYLDFSVEWDAQNNCVIIDTESPYIAQ